MYADLPTLTTAANWADLLDGAGQAALEAILPGYIHPRRLNAYSGMSALTTMSARAMG